MEESVSVMMEESVMIKEENPLLIDIEETAMVDVKELSIYCSSDMDGGSSSKEYGGSFAEPPPNIRGPESSELIKTDDTSNNDSNENSYLICGKRFKFMESLHTHFTDGAHLHRCYVCYKQCRTQDALERHIKTHSSVPKKSTRKMCEICGKRLMITNDQHQCGEIGTENRYVCYFCSKEFVTKRKLAVHMKIHTSEESFGWNLCNETLIKAEIKLLNNANNKEEVVTQGDFTESASKKIKPRSEGSCLREANQFCFICGKFLSRKCKRYSVGTSKIIKRAYTAYFDLEVTDLDKPWVPNYICSACYRCLHCWYIAKEVPRYLGFVTPRIWRKPTNHIDDCFFCLAKPAVKRIPGYYPDLPSSSAPRPRSRGMPVPINKL